MPKPSLLNLITKYLMLYFGNKLISIKPRVTQPSDNIVKRPYFVLLIFGITISAGLTPG